MPGQLSSSRTGNNGPELEPVLRRQAQRLVARPTLDKMYRFVDTGTLDLIPAISQRVKLETYAGELLQTLPRRKLIAPAGL